MAIVTSNGTEYVGKVLATRHENMAHDSYFYAYVWDNGAIAKIEYDSTAHAGGGSATVDYSELTKCVVTNHMMNDLESYVAENGVRAPVAVGTRVKSLTTKGKAYGVVGTVVGTGEGRHGSYVRVKDESSGKTVIVSTNRVQSLDTIDLDRFAYMFALVNGDGKDAFHFGPYCRWGISYLVKDALDAYADVMRDVGTGKLFADWDDYVSDMDSEDHNAWIHDVRELIAL